MAHDIKISVIIPVYNSELYIGQCIESVIRQTYSNWEIIVVDDGSADRSNEICSKLSAADGRIRVFSQEHRGVSAARNRGIEEAAGEFLLFLDSDDLIHRLLMENYIYLAAKHCADLLLCNYRRVTSRQIEEEVNRDHRNGRELRYRVGTGKEAEKWFHEKYTRQLAAIGGKMVRKSLLAAMRFDETLKKGEDTLLLYTLISRRIRIVYLFCDRYYYRSHSNSTVSCSDIMGNDQYFMCSRKIRDQELKKGRVLFSLTWERILLVQMEDCYRSARIRNDFRACRRLKRSAHKEMAHLLYRKVDMWDRLMFASCFYCYPLFIPMRKTAMILWRN